MAGCTERARIPLQKLRAYKAHFSHFVHIAHILYTLLTFNVHIFFQCIIPIIPIKISHYVRVMCVLKLLLK